ncbi:MAG: phosphoribosylformylglycinamidine synthase, partial [Candidatus Aenigmarchaeota archaeon]|nr:phosphoribosylformylglycinamidine synthase [Candidatus Aenigmarchaeota archaeon]
MPARLEISVRPEFRDILGGKALRGARFVDVYSIDANLTKIEKAFLCNEVLGDRIINTSKTPTFDYAAEIQFLPGVTDNVGATARQAVEEALGRKVAIHYSRMYGFSGARRREIEKFTASAHNPLVEKAIIYDRESFRKRKPYIPEIDLKGSGVVEAINRNDGNLMEISKSRLLALSREEMAFIKNHFGQKDVIAERRSVGLSHPTDVEIECIAQTWSEHCKHKIFNAKIEYNGKIINSLFRTFIKKTAAKRDDLVSVFDDNAGIVRFNKDWNFAAKVETHNAPSALDPYGGALTGILWVNRDIMGAGLGARPIFNTDVFCFANPSYKGKVPKNLFHPKRTFEGVRRGVQDGGNKSGIPTVNGSIFFDDRFLRPLVFCGTCGIMPSEIAGKNSSKKRVLPGDVIIMIGGRVGCDGIHGATFSSQALDANSPSSAVQLGDPITQKKIMDFLIEARDLCLYNSITDNGAGGLSSSIGEMARLCGAVVWLDKVPLKYPGLKPWEIFLSESQERMTLSTPKRNAKKLGAIAKKHDVELTIIGKLNKKKKRKILYGKKTVAFIDTEFLHSTPQLKLKARWKNKVNAQRTPKIASLGKELLSLLSRPNIRSKEDVIRQYDHEVQGGSIVKPLTPGPSDAAVIRPILSSDEGIVVSNGICPRVEDPYMMACFAVDEAVRNAVAVGADPKKIYGLDNFCWPDPVQSETNKDGEEKLGALVRACQGLLDSCRAFGVPCISGKDSMKNDYIMGKKKISIPPTLLFTAIGKINDVKKTVTMDFKDAGDI